MIFQSIHGETHGAGDFVCNSGYKSYKIQYIKVTNDILGNDEIFHFATNVFLHLP